MSNRILILENDSSCAKTVQRVLAGHSLCDIANSLEEGLCMARTGQYDAYIVDLALDGEEDDGAGSCESQVSALTKRGLSFLMSIRKKGGTGGAKPIIITSMFSSTDTIVRALRYGADDFISKPFNNIEFKARLDAVMRRAIGCPDSLVHIGKKGSLGHFCVNLSKQCISNHKDEVICLTKKEFCVVRILASSKNSVLEKSAIMNKLYPDDYCIPDTKIIDVFMCKLRKKLAKCSGNNKCKCIRTVWGRGYMLTDDFEEDDDNTCPIDEDNVVIADEHVNDHSDQKRDNFGYDDDECGIECDESVTSF